MRFVTNDVSMTREQAQEWFDQPKGKIAIDIETVSIENKLPLGVGIAVNPALAFYFFNTHDELISRMLETSGYSIYQNAKFDIPLLRSLGHPVGEYEDTEMIAYAAGILEKSLAKLSENILHKDYTPVTTQWKKKDQGNVGIDHMRMAGWCMVHAMRTYELECVLPKTDLYLTIDKPSIELLIEMEGYGLLIDQYRLTRVEQAVANKVFPLEAELKQELGVENLNSNPQVAVALRNLGIIGTRKTKSDKDSVSDDSLKPLNLPLTNNLLKYRSLMKNMTTYVPALRRVDHEGRIHTSFGFTNTGRWSSKGPNFQNFTRDDKYKE